MFARRGERDGLCTPRRDREPDGACRLAARSRRSEAAHRSDPQILVASRRAHPGSYVNDMPRAATAREISANYRGNYERLATIKAKYDPTNLFRLNANVQPKASA